MNEIAIHPEHDGRRAFNASLCEFEGALWMAYRVSYANQPDRLWIDRINPKTLRPAFSLPLDVPLSDGWGAEDPRLFVHDDELHVAWTAADYARKPWRATMFYGRVRFDAGRIHVPVAHQPRYGLNLRDQREKNWQFFSLGGCLFAQYSPSPQRVIQLVGDRVVGEWRSPGFVWNYGSPSGGTPPIKTKRGTLLTFFHSHIPHPTRQRVYSFAAMEFQAVAPFSVLRVSTDPMTMASDRWPTASDEWSPLCVFPGGAVHHNGGLLVSSGTNDCGIRLFEIDPANDMPMTDPIPVQAEPTAYFRTLVGFLFGDRVREPGEIIEAPLSVARKLLTRNWITHENQTA